MTKDKDVFTTNITVDTDPRSKHTAEDRRAQFELSMKLYNLLGEMTFAVDRITGVRSALDERASKLPAGDPLAANLHVASKQVDDLRKPASAPDSASRRPASGDGSSTQRG